MTDVLQLDSLQLDSRALFDAMPDAVIVVAPAGTIVAANRQCEPLLGYQPEELVGRLIETIVPEAVRDVHVRYRSDYVAEARVRPMSRVLELQAQRKDGGLVPVDVALAPVSKPDGSLDAVIAVARDLSERRQLEDALRQAQKLEGLGQLAAGIAHDFNNVLTTVLGHADLIRAGLKGADARTSGEAILLAAEHGAALTQQLLAFGRKQVLQPEPLDLNEVLLGLDLMLRRVIGEDVELRIRTAAKLSPVVADQGHLQQIVLNLVVNARDAMPTGGVLTVATEETSEWVRLSVSDTGVGIDAAARARIFEPFFTTKPAGQGTGLGLATVYGIVTQSGGRIDVESEPGRGSTFAVSLPRAAARAAATVPDAAPSALGGNETILVAEDEDAVRSVIAGHLRSLGYTVLEARNGREALDLVNADGIDLVLTDTVMPEMSGPEFAAHLIDRRLNIGIVYMSGYTDSALARHGAFPDTSLYLAKPFTVRELARHVRRALDKPSA